MQRTVSVVTAAKKKKCSVYPSSIEERQHADRKTICNIYPSSIVESRFFFCSIYRRSSIVEGQHMYRQEDDGLTPGQLKKKKAYPRRPHYKGTVTLTAVQSAVLLSQLCPHKKCY